MKINDYMYCQCCRPINDLRVNEVIEFLSLMKNVLGCSEIFDKNDKPIELTTVGLTKVFEKKLKRERFPGIGVSVSFFSIPPSRRDDNTIRFEIHTGTHPEKVFIDFYDMDIGESHMVPDLKFLKKSITIFKPFEAYLSEHNNEMDMNSYDRQRAIPKFTKPSIIRGFHYLDKDMANSIGGIKKCLKAPASKIETFCEGVLIQLTEGLFDSENPEHLKIQRDVMKFLKV